MDYLITYTHGSWGYEQVINVEIDADDLESPPNSMSTDVYSFTTESTPEDTDPRTPNPMTWAVEPYGSIQQIASSYGLDSEKVYNQGINLNVSPRY